MKNCKAICSLLAVLILLCSISVSAFAQTPPDLIDPPPAASSHLESEAAATMDPLPQAADITPEPSEASTPSEQSTAPEDAEIQDNQEEALAPRSSNTPYFIGAVIAVLVLIGVALYCKFNGNGNR